MARQKEGVSRANPCQICGRTDGDFRLIDEDGFVTHWCFRGPDRSISGFVHTGQHQSKIALYQIYQSDADYHGKKALEKERWLAKKDLEDPGWRKRWAREQELKNPNFRREYSKERHTAPAPAIPLVERKVYKEHPEFNKVASAERRDEVYRAFLSLLKVEGKHLQKLHGEWGTETASRIQKWGIRSLPPIDCYRFRSGETYYNLSRKQIMERLLVRVGPPEYVPGFYKKNGAWTFSGLSGIVYPIWSLDGKISCLRVANDYPDVKGEYQGRTGVYSHQWQNGKHIWKFTFSDTEPKEEVVAADVKLKPEGIPYGKTANKYLYFNSCKEAKDEENLLIYNEREKGAKAGSHPGLFMRKGDSYCIVDATEGEKKSIINNEVTGHPTICLPGVGTWAMLFDPKEGIDGRSWFEILMDRGMRQLNVMYDADKYENERVMNAQVDFVTELSKYPQILVCVGEWSTAWGKKGLDDILLAGVMPRYIPVQIQVVKD